MLRLATVFSGIGAIEHALDRMNIDHEIVFACDNGDVELETPKIKIDINAIEIELKSLKKKVQTFNSDFVDEESVNYVAQLDVMLVGVDYELKKLLEALRVSNEELKMIYEAVNDTTSILKSSMDISKASKKKKYKELLEIRKHNASDEANLFFILRVLLTLINDEIEFDSEPLKTIAKKYVDNLYAGKESQNKVRQSYMANYKISENNFHWNVAFLDGKQYEGQVDLFVGGSPCQSFSLVGKQRGLEDTRGTLFYEYARLIKEIKPKVFIYENVKAILSNDGGRTWEKMKEVFADLGYRVYYTYNNKPSVLNARDYGIPQNRERMFVVGFRADINMLKEFEFPAPIPLKKKMQDILLDNVSGAYYLPKKGVDFVTSEKNLTKRYTQIDGEIALCQKKNQQFNWHGDFIFVEENKNMEKTMEDLEKYFLSEKVEKYVMATGTKKFYSRPETDLEVARPLLTTMHKMHRAGVDNYVHTNGRLRKLTPRECLRLMGFCDSFKIVVSDTSMYQQAGNSIVVDVLIAIMREILSSVAKNEIM